MSGPFENCLANFCRSALLKALKINFLYRKKADGQTLKSAEVQKSTREFSHGLDLSSFGSALVQMYDEILSIYVHYVCHLMKILALL